MRGAPVDETELTMQDFIAWTESTEFDGAGVLHRFHTIEYGSRQAGSSAADATDKYYPRVLPRLS